MQTRKCAIIGASAGGLPSARWALAYGLTPVVFEKSRDIGGIWNYRENQSTNSTMKSTVLNTTKEMSAFSDLPPPKNFANYMHNTSYLQYLRLYCKTHNLLPHIRMGHEVKQIKRTDDYAATGMWVVEYIDSAGTLIAEHFECVVMAVGHNSTPHTPSWPDQHLFTGNITHSKDYKVPTDQFQDKVNLVVGIGMSAVDIAVELSRVSKQVFLSTKTGAFIYSKVGAFGRPNGMIGKSRFHTYFLNKLLPGWVLEWMIRRRLQARFDHIKYGLLPEHSVFVRPMESTTVNDELPCRIMCGEVQMMPDIEKFTEHGVVFSSRENQEEQVDNVILATGFCLHFNQLVEKGQLLKVHHNYLPLFKNIVPEDLVEHCSFGVIGLIQPTGAILSTMEMQARFFFHLFSSKHIQKVNLIGRPDTTPSLQEIRKEIKERAIAFGLQPCRQCYCVDFTKYMDELADIIGCKPNPASFLWSDPKLSIALMFKANVPYVYRLVGPNVWSGAREAILTVDSRVDEPFKTRVCSEAASSKIDWLELAGLFLAIVVFVNAVFEGMKIIM